MSEHRFRHAHSYGLDPFREWIRRELPGARDGVVVIDMDYAVRRYGHQYGLDSNGDLMFIEKKESANAHITDGQRRIYEWCKVGIESDKYVDRFRGNHVLNVEYTEQWETCPSCSQSIRTDADKAYDMFLSAQLKWDGKTITHEHLKQVLVETKKQEIA